MKIKLLKNGALVSFERTIPSGYYSVILRGINGEIIDKVKTDTYRGALDYKKAFLAIGRNLK